mgnify:CR=1 FL=1
MNQPSAPLRLEASHNNFYAALGAAALMIGIAVAAVVILGGDGEQLLWTLIIFGGIWGVILLFSGVHSWNTVRRERRDAESLFTGEAWAIWRWSLEEWGRELESRRRDFEQRERWQRRAPLLGGIAGIIIGGCLLIPIAASGEEMPPVMQNFIIALAIFFFCLSVILSISGALRERRRWQGMLDRAAAHPAPRVWFGPYGYYHETDGHTPLRRLENVSVDHKKRRLVFTREYTGSRGVTYALPTSLPVPAAHMDDAEALAQRYRSERGLR